MNWFLGIKKDADIITGNYADENNIAAFENDESIPGPTAPYSPDWSNIKGPWNHTLLEDFTLPHRFQVDSTGFHMSIWSPGGFTLAESPAKFWPKSTWIPGEL